MTPTSIAPGSEGKYLSLNAFAVVPTVTRRVELTGGRSTVEPGSRFWESSVGFGSVLRRRYRLEREDDDPGIESLTFSFDNGEERVLLLPDDDDDPASVSIA